MWHLAFLFHIARKTWFNLLPFCVTFDSTRNTCTITNRKLTSEVVHLKYIDISKCVCVCHFCGDICKQLWSLFWLMFMFGHFWIMIPAPLGHDSSISCFAPSCNYQEGIWSSFAVLFVYVVGPQSQIHVLKFLANTGNELLTFMLRKVVMMPAWNQYLIFTPKNWEPQEGT